MSERHRKTSTCVSLDISNVSVCVAAISLCLFSCLPARLCMHYVVVDAVAFVLPGSGSALLVFFVPFLSLRSLFVVLLSLARYAADPRTIILAVIPANVGRT